jgi:hypothetical protein
MPRLNPGTLLSIYPRHSSLLGTRCLRNKPSRALPPRQSSLGMYMPSMGEVQHRADKITRGKKKVPKVPLVPQFDEDGTPIEPEIKAPEDLPKPRIEDMTEKQLEEEKRLKASEARVRAFEREQKGLSGMTEEEALVATFEDHVDTLDPGVVQENPNTVAYPRDVVGTKIRKEKVKYKVDVYGSFER